MAIISNKTSVPSILVGDAVSPAIANAPHTGLETNVDNLIAYNKAAVTGYFEKSLTTSTGLTFGYRAGVIVNNNVTTNVAAGTLALTASSVNYIEVNSS